MMMNLKNQRLSIRFPVAALVFAMAHLVFEHMTGGVQSHHILANPDLPSISNWFGLLTHPVVGIAAGFRLERPNSALIGALVYGAVLAISFEFGASMLTNIAFFGLIACALVFPIYRAEYILGFMMGMTFTFGGVLPLIIALIFATISFVVRGAGGWIVARVRKG